MRDATSNLSHPKYRPDIDGLRAVAVLSVVAFHAFPKTIKGGFVGVDIFFVISGYLISLIIFENVRSERFRLSAFYARRIKRIFPSLIVILVTSFLVGWFVLLADEFKQFGKHVTAAAAFVSNLVLWGESGYFDTAAETKPLLHLWSLGIEEQFYVVWPLLIWVTWKKRIGFLAVSVGFLALSFGLNLYGIREDAVATFYSPLTRFWELLCGGLLAAIHSRQDGQSNVITRPLTQNLTSASGLALLVLGIVWLTKESAFPGWLALIPAIGALLTIAAGGQCVVSRLLLANPIAVWIGLISYPLYLWHWPILSFARIVEGSTPNKTTRIVAVLLSIALAWLTYRFVEIPIRFGSKADNKAKIIGLATIMSVLALAGCVVYWQDGFDTRAVVKNNTSPPYLLSVSAPMVPQRCSASNVHSIANSLCTMYEQPGAIKKILLWGDSSTGAWMPAFQKLSTKHHFTLFNLMQVSCPPILEARKTKFDFEGSRKYCVDGSNQKEAIALMKEIKPDFIVVIAAWNSYSEYSNREFITDRMGEEATRDSTKRTVTEHLSDTLRELSTIGNTIVFTSWPYLPETPFNRRIVLPEVQIRTPEVFARNEEFMKDSHTFNEIFDPLKNSNIKVFDPAKKICRDDKCVSVLDGVLMYADTYHISPLGSLLFIDDIEQLILHQ